MSKVVQNELSAFGGDVEEFAVDLNELKEGGRGGEVKDVLEDF